MTTKKARAMREPMTPLRDAMWPLDRLDRRFYPYVDPEVLDAIEFKRGGGLHEAEFPVTAPELRARLSKAAAERVAAEGPARDPLEVALEAARGLSWWDAKVEAKAVEIAPHEWRHALVEGPNARKAFLKRLSKVRTYDPAKQREENERKWAKQKAERAATKGARLAEIRQKAAALRREEQQYRAVMDEAVARLPEKDRAGPVFHSKAGREAYPRYREALHALLANLKEQSRLATVARAGT